MRRLLTLLFCAMVLGGMLAVVVQGPLVGPPPRPDPGTRLDPDVAALIDSTIGAVEREPVSPRAWMKLGLVYEANALYPAARTSYRQALALESGSPQCWYHLGLVEAELGDADAAIESMKRAGRLDPKYAPARWRIGFWQLERRQPDDAMLWFQRALAIDPDDAAANLGLARALVQRGDDDEAARWLQRWRDREGANADYARFLLAGVCRRLGRPEDAPPVTAGAHGVQPVWDDPWRDETRWFRPAFGSRLLRAEQLQRQGRFEEAITILEALRVKRPDDVTALVNLGASYHGAGHTEEAVRVLRVAADRHPGHFAPHLNLAAVCFARGDHEEALAHADRAVALNRHLAAAHEARGLVLAALGRMDEARAALAECRRLDPGRESARAQ